jgi:molecular chaperone DnaK (HSP70)
VTYAIDFGTSNTVIARWNAATQQSEIVKLGDISDPLAQTSALVPSLVYVENARQNQVLVGQQVRDRGYDIQSDPRFFRGFKRGIGTPIQGFMPTLDEQATSFEQVGQWFLNGVMAKLSALHPDAKESLILTVPVDSFETYRHWLGSVVDALAVEKVRIIDEPTAAALGYNKADQDLLLVVDFGGGTLDLALVQLNGTQRQNQPLGFILKWGEKSFAENSGQRLQTARVIAKSGQNLGGTDIDQWILDHFAKTQNLEVSPLTSRLAERLKIQLSLQQNGSEVYFDAENFNSIDLTLERSELEAILTQQSFFERLDSCMAQILQQAKRQGFESSDIDAVLMVGGSSQIPAVQRWVETYFDRSKVMSHRPFDAIASGALQLVQGVEVTDFLYHSYGVRFWDRRQQAHAWHPIIPSGQPYPMTQPIELVLGASTESQPSIELIIGELGNEFGGTEVFFDGDRLITRPLQSSQTNVQPLNDTVGGRNIATLSPPGYPGSDRIKVLFQVDDQRALRITVEDLLTQERLVTNQMVASLS